MIRILGISGSLRQQSSNTVLLSSVVALLPGDTEFQVFEGIGDLPHFNPDLDQGHGIEAVNRWRAAVKAADAVLFSTPEYAFGVPGVLKNALDWLVSSGELNEKPVAAISASPLYGGGDKAMASLLLTLKALGTEMSGFSSYSIPSVYQKVKGEEITDTETAEKLTSLLAVLCEKPLSPKQD